MSTEPTYTVTLTRTQLAAVRDACELLSRIHIGQLEHVAEKLHGLPHEHSMELEKQLRRLNHIVTGLESPHASRAQNETMRLHHQVAWGIYHAARYQLYMEQLGRASDGNDWSVMSRPPNPEGGQPVPKIKRTVDE
ncbi:hypothetical protein Q0M94_28545 (plasmid) [Deinococcus radiomollis]|uniref:hypothetical protein n=1 Tax=Deinococcus radiomollis TaxID=468916 RepID=UPI0038923731